LSERSIIRVSTVFVLSRSNAAACALASDPTIERAITTVIDRIGRRNMVSSG
jgi:hypothetical protein